MRVLLAPDSFGGTLSAPEAADALATGWRRSAPDDELELCPLSDGGPGFVEALHGALGGRLMPVEVSGPRGEPALAVILLTDGAERVRSLAGRDLLAPGGPAGAAVPTAYVESAQACGLALVEENQRDPRVTSTVGVGRLVAAALGAGAGRVVIGLGGSATNDGGAGMLSGLAGALGVDGLPAVLSGGGAGLKGLDRDRLGALPALRDRVAGTELVIASDVDVVLLGFKGASAMFGRQKGATDEVAQQLDLALSDFARACVEATGQPQKLVAEPGAGAAGGLGFGLALLGARREPGAATVAEAVGLRARIARNDLVVTGEGSLDWQSLHGKVVAAVAGVALETGVPTVAIAGQVSVGRRELLSIGVESAYPVARTPEEIAASLADPAARLADRAARVARTWSPRR
jgi:glycerate 2-kinase